MPVIALLLGSFIGFFGAIFGWIVMDLSMTSALAVYVGTSLGLFALTMVTGFVRCRLSNATPVFQG